MDRDEYATAVLGQPASYINTHRWERERSIRAGHVVALARFLRLGRDEVTAECAAVLGVSEDEVRALAADRGAWERACVAAGWRACLRGDVDELRRIVLG